MQAQMMQNMLSLSQRREDDESGALKINFGTIAHGVETLGHLVGAGTDITK